MKYILLFSLLSICALGAEGTPDSATPQESANTDTTYMISEECNQYLKDINQDYGELLTYFQGVFKSLIENNRTDAEFSTLLSYFQTSASGIDKVVTKNYAPATTYLFLVSKHGPLFDAEFKKQLALQPAGKEAEAWHSVETLFNAKLKEEVINYKTRLVRNDAEWVKMRKQGVFRRGNTVYINPDLAEKNS
jgi:hypothetical protein